MRKSQIINILQIVFVVCYALVILVAVIGHSYNETEMAEHKSQYYFDKTNRDRPHFYRDSLIYETKINPENGRTWLEYGLYLKQFVDYMGYGVVSEKLDTGMMFLTDDRDIAMCYYAKANMLNHYRELEKCKKLYLQSLDYDDSNMDAYDELCCACKNTNDIDLLEQTAIRMHNKDNKDSLAYEWLTYAYIETGDIENAEICCEKSMEFGNYDERIYFYKGNILEKKGKMDEAFDAYYKSFIKGKTDYSHKKLAQFVKEERYMEKIVEKTLKDEYHGLTGLSILSDYYIRKGNFEAARPHIEYLEQYFDDIDELMNLVDKWKRGETGFWESDMYKDEYEPYILR